MTSYPKYLSYVARVKYTAVLVMLVGSNIEVLFVLVRSDTQLLLVINSWITYTLVTYSSQLCMGSLHCRLKYTCIAVCYVSVSVYVCMFAEEERQRERCVYGWKNVLFCFVLFKCTTWILNPGYCFIHVYSNICWIMSQKSSRHVVHYFTKCQPTFHVPQISII